MDSAMLVSGSLPMSSAEIASTMLVDLTLGVDRVLDADADAGDGDALELLRWRRLLCKCRYGCDRR